MQGKMLGARSTGAICFAAVCALGWVIAGCTDDNASTTPTGSSGAAGSGGSGGTAGSGGSAGGAGDASDSLYTRLGGHAGIRGAVEAIVGAELKDPEIASFFAFQTAATPTAGHPTADQLEECFTIQLSAAAGGPETYPATLGADKGSYACRASMVAIHQGFHISGAQFDKFIMIAGTTLSGAGVSAADITTIASVLNSTKAAIVDPAADGGPFTGGPGQDGGTTAGDAASDAPTTLYQRLGGHAGIRSALDQVVAAELADTTIAPYFSAQTAGTTPQGHPNADQVEECLTNQLAAAAGGTETYPLTLPAAHGSWVCRDMMTIHQSMGISSETFDKFVMIAAGKLISLGVSNADVTTIGTVLNGAKPQIVSASDAGHD